MYIKSLLLALSLSLVVSLAHGEDYSYAAIAKRYPDSQLDARAVETAKMHGECLVGLKQLNFVKSDTFDPVREWTSLRSWSLLEQFPPCNVLIIMEVARDGLLEEQAEK